MHRTSEPITAIGLIKTVLKDAALVLTLLLGLELIVRIVAPQPLQTMLRYVYEPAKKYSGFQFIPGARTMCNNGFGDHIFAINQWRCRDRDYGPKQPGETRILVIGDSYSENQGLNIEQIYPKVLEAQLNKKYPGRSFSVINAGMAGWRLWHFYDYLEDMLPVIKPDVVVLAVGATSNAYITYQKPAVPDIEILAGLPVKAQASVVDRLPWGIWFAGQMLESYSHAYIAFRRAAYYPSLWLKIGKVPIFHPLCLHPDQINKLHGPTLTVIKEIQRLCAKNSVTLAMLNVPHYYECIPQETWLKIQLENPDVSKLDVTMPARFISGIARQLSIPFYDPSADLAAAPQPVYLPVFLHWNERGNQVVADGLLRFIEEKQLLNPSP